MSFVQLPHLQMHYRLVGHGPQPILFVHGSFASGRWWQPVAELLPAQDFTCYLVDLRGSGQSSGGDDPSAFAIEQQAADLAALLEALDLSDLHLVGHSLGAAVALTHALADPSRLRSLVLVSTPSPAGTPTPPQGLQLLAQMRSDRGLLLQALASTMPARAPDPFFQQLVQDAWHQAPAAFTANAQALAAWRAPDTSLARLRLPVLLVWGDRDQIVERSVQQRLLLGIPGANNLEVFRAVGHSPMLERPEGFAQVLVNFIGQDFESFDAIRAGGEAVDHGHDSGVWGEGQDGQS